MMRMKMMRIITCTSHCIDRPVLPCGGDSDELGYENIDREEGRNKNEDEDELA